MEIKRQKNKSGGKDTQLAMPIKQSRSELVYGLKRNLDRGITYAGVLPYWRSFLFVMAFLSSIFAAGIVSYVLYLNFAQLPDQIPMLFNQATKTWAPINKQLLIGLPVSMFFYAGAMTYLNSRIFSFDRRLVQVLNLSTILANIFLLIGFGQILSLLLVY